MHKSCTLKDIAKKLGVTPSTVSRVLNDAPAAKVVSDSMRKKIRDTAESLGYVPDVNAKRLVKSRSGLMAIVLPMSDVGEPSRAVMADRSLALVLGGIAETLNSNDYRMMLIFNDARFVERRDYIKLFRERAIDGMIVWGARENESFWREAAELNIVMMNTRDGKDSPFPFVGNDNFKAAFECARRMIEAGRRKIAYVDCYKGISVSDERQAGYKKALEEAGIPFRDDLFFLGNDQAPIAEFLASAKDFDAVHCVNDRVAALCGGELVKRGIDVPRDVLLSGGDRVEDPYAMPLRWRIPMISYRFPCERMGEIAASRALAGAKGSKNADADIVKLDPIIIDETELGKKSSKGGE